MVELEEKENKEPKLPSSISDTIIVDEALKRLHTEKILAFPTLFLEFIFPTIFFK